LERVAKAGIKEKYEIYLTNLVEVW
jgi:hypothetical protein